MIAIWFRTVSLFSGAEKKKVGLLLLCSVLIGLLQLAGVASIMPFVAALTSPDLVTTQPVLARAYDLLGFADYRSFVIALGVFSFCILVIGHALELTYAWVSIRFINLKESDLSTALLMSYLTQDFAKVSNRNTSELSKNILEDVEKVITGILLSGMEIVNSSISALFIVGLLLFMDPEVTLTIAFVFVVCYGVIFLFLSPRIRKLGTDVQDLYAQMYVKAMQALDALKEIKATDREQPFVREYAVVRKASALNFIRYSTMELLPKQLLELTAFGAVIGISLYFVYRATDPGVNYSILAAFAFAAYRIIPMIKDVFDHMESFDYYRSFIDSLWNDLARVSAPAGGAAGIPGLGRIARIELENIRFRYEPGSEPVLNGIDLLLEAGQRVCLVGPSGAGKTTTVDIVLGLLRPEHGAIRVNGTPVSIADYGSVRARIGYVPQNPYLLDATVEANILFGEDEADEARLAPAYETAGLAAVFGAYGEAALGSRIGQRGMRLSGGQRQRIAIARALYRRPDLLILDESTNELDLATEQSVINALTKLDGIAILFVSHRPSVMRFCDRLVVLEAGRMVMQGTYAQLGDDPQYQALVADLGG